MIDYHARFLTLVDEIERTYSVTRWRIGDVPVWPLARRTLYVDLYSQMHRDRTREKLDAWQIGLTPRSCERPTLRRHR